MALIDVPKDYTVDVETNITMEDMQLIKISAAVLMLIFLSWALYYFFPPAK